MIWSSTSWKRPEKRGCKLQSKKKETYLFQGNADRPSINLSDVVVEPKTPPCFDTMEIAAAWLAGSVAAVQSSNNKHSYPMSFAFRMVVWTHTSMFRWERTIKWNELVNLVHNLMDQWNKHHEIETVRPISVARFPIKASGGIHATHTCCHTGQNEVANPPGPQNQIQICSDKASFSRLVNHHFIRQRSKLRDNLPTWLSLDKNSSAGTGRSNRSSNLLRSPQLICWTVR